MHYALVNEKRAAATRTGDRGICPECGQEVIAKCGSLVVSHWAHVATAGEETCWASEPKTQWHIDWQNKWDEQQREVIIKSGQSKHIADIVANVNGINIVIEFQHSSISSEDIKKREDFYERMVWVFDARAEYKSDKIKLWRENNTPNNYYQVAWESPKRTLFKCEKQVYLHLGQGLCISPLFNQKVYTPFELNKKKANQWSNRELHSPLGFLPQTIYWPIFAANIQAKDYFLTKHHDTPNRITRRNRAQTRQPRTPHRPRRSTRRQDRTHHHRLQTRHAQATHQHPPPRRRIRR